MSETRTITNDITPSATPTEDAIRRWQTLPCDEQVKRLRQTLSEATASGISDKSMDDIEKSAKKRLPR